MTEKDTTTLSVIWPGNLCQTDKNAKTEEALEPWLSPVYEVDHPHLGNPWCDLGKACQYEDTNNPEGLSVNGGAMKDHRVLGEKLYHLAPLFSINVRANC